MLPSFVPLRRALLCGVIALAQVVGPTPRPHSQRAQRPSTPAFRLYRLNDSSRALLPLDPRTLRDLQGVSAIRLGRPAGARGPTLLVATPRGRAVAAVFFSGPDATAGNQTIQLIDLRTGKLRGAPFHPAVPAFIDAISPDGQQLMAHRPWTGGQPDQPTMRRVRSYLLRARDGHLLRSWTVRPFCCGPNLSDPAHHRLYSLLIARADAPTSASQIPTLLVRDLMGYRVLGRLPFPDLHAGWWLTNRQVQGETVVRHWDPGIALTPDGRQIALVDGVSHQLTVIDAATLRLVRRVPLLERRGLLAQFGSWLGFLPETAEAKGMGTDGVSLDAWFSLDGQRLYLTGTTGRVTRGNSLRTTDLGLRVVDVSSGTIVATRFRGQNPLDVILSPDGRSLYVTLPGATTGRTIVGCPCSMERLDARTLRTRAVRRSLGTATTVPRLVAVPVPGAP